MSGQHRATPSDWFQVEQAARFGERPDYNCILELRARVEALEDGATCPHIVSSDEGTSYCGLAEQGAAPVTPMDELRAASAEARPGGLVERVGRAIDAAPYDEDLHQWDEARAAIRAVASWLRTGLLMHAADLLEMEADR